MDATKTHLARQLKHNSPIISCRFDRAGKYVFFGAQDSRVWRWQWDSEQKTEFAGHDSWCRAMAFDSANETLITGGYDGRLIWWPLGAEKPEPIRRLDAHHGWIRAIAVSPDGRLVASVGVDRTIRLWDVADGSLVREMAGHESDVYNVAFHPQGDSLATSDLKGNLFHWETATGRLVRQFRAASLHKYDETFKADIGGCRGLEFSADGARLAGGGMANVTNAFAGVGEPAVVVFDWQSGKEVIQHESKGKLRGVIWGVAFHPENLLVAVSGGGGGGFLLFWKPDQKEEVHQFKLPNTGRDMDLSSDHLHVAVAHFDSHVRVYRLAEKA
jgi:WD40 repeat protein